MLVNEKFRNQQITIYKKVRYRILVWNYICFPFASYLDKFTKNLFNYEKDRKKPTLVNHLKNIKLVISRNFLLSFLRDEI